MEVTKCVGAFLRPCDNQTDTVLCADCYAFVDRVLEAVRNPTRRSAAETRVVYRPRHGRRKAA